MRNNSRIVNDVLEEDVAFTSLSVASAFVVFASTNGWTDWKNKQGQPVDIYRPKKNTAKSDE
jgi:hypothetical protein